MKQHHLLLALFLGVIVGCVANESLRLATANAQPGPSGFRECVSMKLGFDSDLEDLPGEAKPIGDWTPVGGGADQAANWVILCR